MDAREIIAAIAADPALREEARRVVLSDELLSLPALVQENGRQIAELAATVRDNGRQIAEHANQIAALTATIAGQSDRIAALTEAVEENGRQIAVHGNQIAALTATVAEHSNQIAALTATVAEHSNQIAALTATLAEHGNRIAALATDQVAIVARLDQQIADTRELRDILGRFMLATQAGFERLESGLSQLTGRVDGIVTVLEQHTIRLARIEERLG